MANEDELLRTAYEQAVASFTRETNLLFERMNFFLAAMAFLVVAFATLLTDKTWSHSLVTYAVVVLGLILASLFSVTNLMSEAVVLRHRDHVYVAENELFTRKWGPYYRASPAADPKKRSGFWSGHPAIHTVIVPFIFYAFWVATLLYMAWHRGWDRWLALGAILGLMFPPAMTLCHFSPNSGKGGGLVIAIRRLCWFRPKPKVSIRARISQARAEETHSGWIRVSKELRVTIPNGAYVKVSANARTVYCQIRGTPGVTGAVSINEWYRNALGWEDLPPSETELRIRRVCLLGRIHAWSFHPDDMVRVGVAIGLISLGLGILSLVMAFLPPSIRVLSSGGWWNSAWGLAGLVVGALLVLPIIWLMCEGLRIFVHQPPHAAE